MYRVIQLYRITITCRVPVVYRAPHPLYLDCCRRRSILARMSVVSRFSAENPLSDATGVLPYVDILVVVVDVLGLAASGAAGLPFEAIDAVDPERTPEEVEDPGLLVPEVRTPPVGLGSPVVVLPASEAADVAGILAPAARGNLVVGCEDGFERALLLAEEREGKAEALAVAVDVLLPVRLTGASATEEWNLLGLFICCLPVRLSVT